MQHHNYDPARHLQQMGVRVDYVDDLPECGRFILDEWRVEVRTGLSPVLERSCLAHEAAHAELRHEEQDIWWCRNAKQERTANAFAGRNLIDFHHFTRLQSAGVGEREMAADLGVARVVLRAYLWLTEPAWRLAA